MEIIGSGMALIFIISTLVIGTGVFLKQSYIYFGDPLQARFNAWLGCIVGTGFVLAVIFWLAAAAVYAVVIFIMTYWIAILGIIVLLIGIGIWSGLFEPADNENANDNSDEKPKSKRTGIIVCCVGLVVFAIGIFGHGGKETQRNVSVATTQQISQNANTGNTAFKEGVDDSKNFLIQYVNKKDQYDKEISALSKEVDVYIQQHSNLKDDKILIDVAQLQGLGDKAQLIMQNVRATKDKLLKGNINHHVNLQLQLGYVLEDEISRVGDLAGEVYKIKIGNRNKNDKYESMSMSSYDRDNTEFNKMWQQTQ